MKRSQDTSLKIMDNRSYYHHENLTTNYSVDLIQGDSQRNETEEENANLLYFILTTLFGTIIVVSNLVTLVSSGITVKKNTKPKLMYLLLGSIALADVLTGFVVIFWQVYPHNLRNQNICAAQISIMVTSTLVNIYTVGIIGIDRFLYIFYGYNHQKWFYPKIIQTLIITIWIFSSLVGFLPLMGWSRELKNQRSCCFVVIVPEKLILLLAILYILPVLIILILYCLVTYRASKKVSLPELLLGKQAAQQLQKTTLQKEKKRQLKVKTENRSKAVPKFLERDFSPVVNVSKRWKAVKVVLFSTNNFLVTWIPYIAVSLYYTSVCTDDSTKKCKSLSLVIASPLAMLGFVNSLVSPIIYAWWHKGFNKYIKRRISTFRLRNPSHSKKIVPTASSNVTMTTILENSNEHITSV